MPQVLNVEHHFMGSELVRDIVFGMSDVLTVSFTLATGLSGIANSTAIVITDRLAGSISIGLGGYLAARSNAEHYAKERTTEQCEIDEIPEVEVSEVEQVFLSYGLEKSKASWWSTPVYCYCWY